jgi:hypothetical protein
VKTLPPPQKDPVIFGRIAGIWATQDPVEAAMWIERISPGPAKDAAAANYAHSVARYDPEGAAAWAGIISDAEQRTSTSTQIAVQWLQSDPVRARQWIASTNQLAADEKQLLLSEDLFGEPFD